MIIKCYNFSKDIVHFANRMVEMSEWFMEHKVTDEDLKITTINIKEIYFEFKTREDLAILFRLRFGL